MPKRPAKPSARVAVGAGGEGRLLESGGGECEGGGQRLQSSGEASWVFCWRREVSRFWRLRPAAVPVDLACGSTRRRLASLSRAARVVVRLCWWVPAGEGWSEQVGGLNPSTSSGAWCCCCLLLLKLLLLLSIACACQGASSGAFSGGRSLATASLGHSCRRSFCHLC